MTEEPAHGLHNPPISLPVPSPEVPLAVDGETEMGVLVGKRRAFDTAGGSQCSASAQTFRSETAKVSDGDVAPVLPLLFSQVSSLGPTQLDTDTAEGGPIKHMKWCRVNTHLVTEMRVDFCKGKKPELEGCEALVEVSGRVRVAQTMFPISLLLVFRVSRVVSRFFAVRVCVFASAPIAFASFFSFFLLFFF